MATPTRDYRYSVEFNIHAVDAPGTRLIKQGDIYVNVCLLGMHRQSRLMPAFLPMHIDQKLYFDKVCSIEKNDDRRELYLCFSSIRFLNFVMNRMMLFND